MKRGLKDDFSSIAFFVAVLWAIYFADFLIPGKLADWGLVPRTLWGLVGIFTSPLLHLSFGHLLSNTIPLVVLLFLLCGSRSRTWPTVFEIVVLGGGLLWLFGRNASHAGASGLVYGLIAFLIVSGFREKRTIPILVALFVGFLYGGTLISGALPTAGDNVSWDGHLLSAIAGAALGYFIKESQSEASETSVTNTGIPSL